MAKLARPVLTRVFPRDRAFDDLDRLRQQPVIWISGPAGCGKTTLASSYIETRRLPCLWYRLDRGDGDSATFFYYLGLAAKKVSPRVKKPLPLLTPEYLQGITTFALRYFENLYPRLRSPSILVFDNYQEVPPEASFHEIIFQGLSNIPEGINVFLISRQDPHPALVRLEANHLMGILPWSELRLTLEESSGIAGVRFQEKLSQKTIQRLHHTADGWAAGLILLLERLKREKKSLPQLGKSMREEIFDYFSSEILDPMDPETQDFLLKTALLPQMTETMAERLTAQPQAGRTLTRLNRGNYFMEKRILEEPVYSYHPLFREFLLSRAEGTFSGQSLILLRRRAAELLEEHGQVESAVHLLQKTGDWETMIQFILRHAPSMLAQGRFSVLEGWLRSLPPELVETRPWLSYWMGSCRLYADSAGSRPYFERAYRQMRVGRDAAGLFLAWSRIVDAIILGYGIEPFSVLDRYVRELEELRGEYPVFPSPEIEARVASSMVGALTLRQPNHPEIEAWAEKALRLAQDQTVISAKVHALFFLTYYQLFRGNREKALLAIDQLRQMSQSPQASPYIELSTKYAEAMHYSLVGLNRECLEAAQAGLELTQRSGVYFGYPGFFAYAAKAAFQMNDLPAGQSYLKKMACEAHSFNPCGIVLYHLVRTNEALVSGNLRQASLHSELALKIALRVEYPRLATRCHLVKARVLEEIGSVVEAENHLKQAANLARRTKSQFEEFCCFLTKAQFALERGKDKVALITLRKALTLGRERGFLSTYIDRPATTARVCMKALEAGIEVDYVQQMIRERNLMPEQPPWHLENWPWPLKVFTLGRFELRRDGNPIRFSKKVQQKPISMLKALIAFGGREVGEDQITDALWPEADGDLAHQSLATNLHRLRQLLGHEKAIQRQENRLTLDDRYCWVDVWVFENLVEQADSRWKTGKIDSAVELIEKAIGLYKGPFLEEEIEQPWTMSKSERLRSMFLRSVRKLGLYWQQSGQLEKTLECYQKGLEVDRLAEEFYQGLMSCYQQLGRRAEAISAYNRCKKALSAALGVEPSAKTETMYRQILSENR